MATVAVGGVGIIPFGKHAGRMVVDMAAEAAYLALKDAGVKPGEIGMGFFASAGAAALFGDITAGQNVFWEVGINRIPVFNIENACTSGSTAFYLACNAISSGAVESALVVGAEKLYVPNVGLINSGANELDTRLGLVTPASFALRAARHMLDFGTTVEQLARVAVKNRRHARDNPVAQFREPLTIEEVLAAPVIADPLTRPMCCPIADGAAAVVLCSPESAARRGRAVNVLSAVFCTGSYENPQDLSRWETDYRACRMAYEQAGVGPES